MSIEYYKLDLIYLEMIQEFLKLTKVENLIQNYFQELKRTIFDIWKPPENCRIAFRSFQNRSRSFSSKVHVVLCLSNFKSPVH